jgi:hypothetical protein
MPRQARRASPGAIPTRSRGPQARQERERVGNGPRAPRGRLPGPPSSSPVARANRGQARSSAPLRDRARSRSCHPRPRATRGARSPGPPCGSPGSAVARRSRAAAVAPRARASARSTAPPSPTGCR